MQFVSNTDREKQKILQTIGKKSFADLIKNIPESALHDTKEKPFLLNGISELQTVEELHALAQKNTNLQGRASFLGAGAYYHFVPSVINSLILRGEFITAYTPYQPEASQGTLQATFEFQSAICELYGMEVANASLYDGASSVVEAAFLAVRSTNRRKILVARNMHPEYRATLKTYAQDFDIMEVPFAQDGRIDFAQLEKLLDDSVAALLIQTPNFFGSIEDGRALVQAAHKVGALCAVSANPLSLGVLEAPGAYDADVAVGEGQPLGISLSFGGPYLGLFSCKQKYVRQVPGRICGITKDVNGQRAYVLTLQTREQHIRRERATSNVCTNEALMALAATIYLSVLGAQGLREVAELNVQKSHYAAQELTKLSGQSLVFNAPFFNEFVLRSKHDAKEIQARLTDRGIVGGLALEQFYPELKNSTLYCVTEMMHKNQIDDLVDALK